MNLLRKFKLQTPYHNNLEKQNITTKVESFRQWIGMMRWCDDAAIGGSRLNTDLAHENN